MLTVTNSTRAQQACVGTFVPRRSNVARGGCRVDVHSSIAPRHDGLRPRDRGRARAPSFRKVQLVHAHTVRATIRLGNIPVVVTFPWTTYIDDTIGER